MQAEQILNMKTYQVRKNDKLQKIVSIPLVNIHCIGISENIYKIQQRQIIIIAVREFRQNGFKPKQSLTKT